MEGYLVMNYTPGLWDNFGYYNWTDNHSEIISSYTELYPRIIPSPYKEAQEDDALSVWMRSFMVDIVHQQINPPKDICECDKPLNSLLKVGGSKHG